MLPATMPINVGNTAFMLLCASLVMLMTPGLAFFYGGLVERKNVLSIMMQSFISLAWTTVLWFAFGYSMCFGPTLARHHRRPDLLCIPAWRDVADHVHGQRRGHPARGPRRVSDDVRHHHARADHRRLYQPRDLQGVFPVPDRLARARVLPVRAHGLESGWTVREMGRARLCRRDRGAQHRRLRRAGFGTVCGAPPRDVAQAAQRAADCVGHGPAVVRLVWL